MKNEIVDQVSALIDAYTPDNPLATADALRALWLQGPTKSLAVIKAEQRRQQESVGVQASVLKAIGKQLAKVARKRVDDFIPLMKLLWEKYGREGRVVATIPLGAMELVEPRIIVPLLRTLCKTCLTWEDSDRLAMYALEPIVKRNPEVWLAEMEPWLVDESVWVRRAGVTVLARLPMKQPEYTAACLDMLVPLLAAVEVDVRKAVSFALRLAARGDANVVLEFLRQQVPPQDAAMTWVLCDAMRSMSAKLLPQFVPLLPLYEQWATAPDLSAKERRSVESALKKLRGM